MVDKDTRFAFEIKNKLVSEWHQTEFFRLGYTWGMSSTTFTHTVAKYLFLYPHIKQITWSNTLPPDPEYIKCKLVHPKQMEFLKELNQVSISKREPVEFAIHYGFYKVKDIKYLNDLREFYVLDQWVQTTLKN